MLTYTFPMRKMRCLIAILFIQIIHIRPVGCETFQHQESGQALRQLEQNVRYHTLSNGMRVILYRRGNAPVFSGALVVKVGGVDEEPGYTGLSHLLEHMAFKGTKTIGTKDYRKEKPLLDRLEVYEKKLIDGKALSSEEQADYDSVTESLKELWILGDFNNLYDMHGASGLNATTDKELTKYFVNLPRNALEFWCWIESERLLNPVMRQFYQERDVVLEERRMRFDDSPRGKLYENTLSVAYLSHPYRYPVIGYEFDIRRLTSEKAAWLHSQYYVAPNIAISLVGDIDSDNDIKLIEKYFSRVPSIMPPAKTLIPESAQVGERQVVIEHSAAKHIYVAYHKPTYPHPDDPAISIMAEILAGGRVSPLYRELVKDRRIVTSIGQSEAPGYSYPNLLIFSAQPNSPHSNQDVLTAFDRVLGKFLQEGPSADELLIAKRSVAMQYLGHLKSNISLAKDFASAALVYNNHLASVEWYDKAMKVSVDDVKRVANQYLTRSNRTVATIENSQRVEGS